jgi:RNA polymerase sigma factor FliA
VDAKERQLWTRWTAQGDAFARESLIQLHSPWARMVARDVYLRTRHRDVDWGDYVQNATVGLIEATDRFHPDRGVDFRTFARHRVRGSVFNGLRQLMDPRQVSINVSGSDRSESLGDGDGDGGGDPLVSFMEWTVGLGIGHLLDCASLPEPVETRRGPYAEAERGQTAALLRRWVEQLPQRERTVLTMHYFQHVPFVVIAGHFGITKGRVSQLHRQAIDRLRKGLHAVEESFVC